MARTLGARDRYPRKTRSDMGKRRKKYAGKKVKTKRQKKLEKRKGAKTHIKLRWMERRRMSKDGWRNWNPKIRPKIKPYVWIFGSVILTPVSEIPTKKDIEDWAVEAIGFPGHFMVLGVSFTARNKFNRKWVKMFEINITENADGLRAKMTRNWRLFRYRWFYKDA